MLVSNAELDAICARVSLLPHSERTASRPADASGPAIAAPANPYELYSELQRSSEFRLDFGPGIDPQAPAKASTATTAATSAKPRAPAVTAIATATATVASASASASAGPTPTALKTSSTTVVARQITIGEGARAPLATGEPQPTVLPSTVVPSAWSTPRQVTSTAGNNTGAVQEVLFSVALVFMLSSSKLCSFQLICQPSNEPSLCV